MGGRQRVWSASLGETSGKLRTRGKPEVPFTRACRKSCLGGEVAAVLKEKHKKFSITGK